MVLVRHTFSIEKSTNQQSMTFHRFYFCVVFHHRNFMRTLIHLKCALQLNSLHCSSLCVTIKLKYAIKSLTKSFQDNQYQTHEKTTTECVFSHRRCLAFAFNDFQPRNVMPETRLAYHINQVALICFHIKHEISPQKVYRLKSDIYRK